MPAEAAPPPAAGDPFAFIDLARLGRNRPRHYLAGLLIIAAGFLLAGLAIAGAAALFRIEAMPGLLLITTAATLLPGAAVLLAVRLVHRRPAMSLVAPDLRLDGRRLLIGGLAWLAVAGGLPLLAVLAGAPLPPLRLDRGLLLFALGALLLVPLQSAAEELIFRGYLTQGLGQLVRHRGALALLVALPFAAMHGNIYGPLSILAYIVLALAFSWVSLGDGRLELAIGAHSANNLLAFIVARASTEPSLLTGEPGTIHLAAIAGTALRAVLFSLLALWLARRLSTRRRGPAAWPADR
ncbi:MAG: type II CAAX endopeptidase family protein [Dongiaceae bacterium]